MSASRSIALVHPSTRALEGGGFPVRRPFPTPGLDQLDPFLLLDEMGPIEWKPGEAIGAPDHPHRGFETITYILAGEVEHRDSSGHSAVLGPGDVQWMTAGGGVIHSELPTQAFLDRGGAMHGFQVWVNLPRRSKRMAPSYLDLPSDRVPSVDIDGAVCRLIAGEALGAKAPHETQNPILYLHLSVQPRARVTLEVPSAWNALAFPFRGDGHYGPEDQLVPEGSLVAFAREEGRLTLMAADRPLEVLVLAAEPLGEPVARYGPFVMNTRDELVEAVRDYQTGRFGIIAPRSR